MVKKPKVSKPTHPSDMNGDSFQSPGGKFIYDMVWEMHGRLSGLEASIRVGGTILVLLLGAILAKLFGVIPD